MSTILIDQVNQMMGTPLTQKEEPSRPEKSLVEKTIKGATIPAALAGIYQLASSQEGAALIIDHLRNHRQDIEKHQTGICAEFTFHGSLKEVVEKIAAYASETYPKAFNELDEAAQMGYRVLLKELMKEDLKSAEVTKFMVDQRHSILAHLPAELQLGHLLGDDTMDDVSNKMEGPISNLMHNLGESFSSSPK